MQTYTLEQLQKKFMSDLESEIFTQLCQLANLSRYDCVMFFWSKI